MSSVEVDCNLKPIPFEEFCEKKVVGKGGFGVIYSTTWTSISEVVALKRVPIDVKTSVKELRLHSSTKHDRIINFFGVSRDEDYYYLVMEFATEGNLRDYLLKNKNILQWEEKIRLATQIAEGLSYLHNECNIVYRDLHTLMCKSNIKISDFGLSKHLDSTSTTSGEPAGVIPFIDPQKFIDPDYKLYKISDIYSMGMIFWEISSCRNPFNERISKYSRIALSFHIAFNNYREEHVIGTPQEYVGLYSDCWKTDPTLRPEINMVLNRLQTMKLTPVFKGSDSSILDSNISERVKAHPIGYFSRFLINLCIFQYFGVTAFQKSILSVSDAVCADHVECEPVIALILFDSSYEFFFLLFIFRNKP